MEIDPPCSNGASISALLHCHDSDPFLLPPWSEWFESWLSSAVSLFSIHFLNPAQYRVFSDSLQTKVKPCLRFAQNLIVNSEVGMLTSHAMQCQEGVMGAVLFPLSEPALDKEKERRHSHLRLWQLTRKIRDLTSTGLR